MNKREIKKSSQSGEIMLEASIVLVMVIVLLFALMSLCFFFYEQATLINLASEISSEVSRTYKYGGEIEFGDREITVNDVLGLAHYRTSFRLVSNGNKVEAKALPYAKKRLNETGMGFDDDDINVTCEIKCSGIGRNYVVVTVEENTEFFLSGFLEFCGITDSETLFQATAYAECNDMMGYASASNFTREISEIFRDWEGFGRLYSNAEELIEAVKNLIGE